MILRGPASLTGFHLLMLELELLLNPEPTALKDNRFRIQGQFQLSVLSGLRLCVIF